jgi:hypothetical protein
MRPLEVAPIVAVLVASLVLVVEVLAKVLQAVVAVVAVVVLRVAVVYLETVISVETLGQQEIHLCSYHSLAAVAMAQVDQFLK